MEFSAKVGNETARVFSDDVGAALCGGPRRGSPLEGAVTRSVTEGGTTSSEETDFIPLPLFAKALYPSVPSSSPIQTRLRWALNR